MPADTAAGDAPKLSCQVSDGFAQWLSSVDGSVALTTYQAGKIMFVSWAGRQTHIFMRTFDKPMGIAHRDDQLAIVTRDRVWLLANSPHQAGEFPPQEPVGFDRLYLPRTTYYTCDLLVHDLGFVGEELWVVNTRFSCLASLSSRFSFETRWQPPFITELAPEDRCHLNGIATKDGRVRYISALGATNEPRGWQAERAAGGIIMDCESGEVVRRGLCMPHSPRWYRDKLWFVNSGRGELCCMDAADEQHTVVSQLPGYLRGLSFVDNFALVGMSLVREKHLFGGLPIGEDNKRLRCGVAVVNLETGELVGTLDFTDGCEEIYDVSFLPGTRRPTLLNLDDPMALRAIVAPEFAYWMRHNPDIDGTT